MLKSSEQDGDLGFTLLEAVVALAIIAALLASFYQVARLSLGAFADAREESLEIAAAGQILSGLGAVLPLKEGSITLSIADGETATVEIRAQPALAPAGMTGALRLLDIDIAFRRTDGSTRSRHIHTLRLAPASAAS